jgi:hypothetical protein
VSSKVFERIPLPIEANSTAILLQFKYVIVVGFCSGHKNNPINDRMKLYHYIVVKCMGSKSQSHVKLAPPLLSKPIQITIQNPSQVLVANGHQGRLQVTLRHPRF